MTEKSNVQEQWFPIEPRRSEDYTEHKMRDIAELTEATGTYELFTHVYWQIVTRRILGFSDLVEYLDPLEEGARKDYVLKSAFPMIREIHWGFFRDLNASTYPVLWGQLCRPHTQYSFAGELKRSMTHTDIYCGFIDIHGYTALTKSTKNAGVLELLDTCIEEDVKSLCREHHVVANRARGDEIILIGTSAYDVVNCTVTIADYLGDQQLIAENPTVKERRHSRRRLPALKISAGISGGKKYDTLVITAGGDLSGPVVNTAARLQSRANLLAPDATRILTTETVRIKYESEAKKQFAPFFSSRQAAFLDLGTFSFKGVDIRLSELVMDSDQMYRMEYRKELAAFLDSLSGHRWHDDLYTALGTLMVAAVAAMPPFVVSVAQDSGKGTILSSAAVGSLIRSGMDRFEAGDSFETAVAALSSATAALEQVPGCDSFLLLYARAVTDEYWRVFRAYDRYMGKFAEEHRSGLLSGPENREYEAAERGAKVHQALKGLLYDKVDLDKRRKLWRHLVKELEPSVDEALYLGK